MYLTKFFKNTNLSPEYLRLFKLCLICSATCIITIPWELFGLKLDITAHYIAFKTFVIFAPPAIYYYLRDYPISKLNILCCAIFYFSCAYATLYFEYSYHTAFFQTFFGTVYFMRFKLRDFFLSHGIGVGFYLYTQWALKDFISESLYRAEIQRMNIATVPIFIISILVYFYIRRQELEAEAKSVFFENIGKNVGFILHEIKQPLKKLQNQESSADEIHELLETASIMWPSKSQVKKAELEEILLKEKVEKVLADFAPYLDYINVELEQKNLDQRVNGVKPFFRIILKNLIKNALEEIQQQEEMGKLAISFNEKNQLIIENTATKKKNTSLLLTAGESTKSNQTNRGLGLYISKKLCDKMNAKLSLNSTNTHFRAVIEFQG